MTAPLSLTQSRKVLAGATFLNMAETGKITEAELLSELDKHLTKECDRKLFGLPGGTKPVPKPDKTIEGNDPDGD